MENRQTHPSNPSCQDDDDDDSLPSKYSPYGAGIRKIKIMSVNTKEEHEERR